MCMKCGKWGKTLNVDHIRPFSLIIQKNKIKTFQEALDCEDLWNIDNGRTLCKDCHKKTPTYGQGAKHYWDLNLIGKHALITGSSKGLGKSIKDLLEDEGVICVGWSRTGGKDLLKNSYSLPKIDILVNNVGGGGTVTDEEYIYEMNVMNMIDYTRQFIEQKPKWGRVITISSIFGKEKGHNPLFTSAKAAQIAFMKSLAGTIDGVTFNTICPGHIDVGKPFPDNPRIIGKPEDVANLVVFLCSDKANHVNGATITVDGGESHSF